MAKRRSKAADASKFTTAAEGTDTAAVEQISRSAEAANKKAGIGHNSSEVTDDVLNQDIERIEMAQGDVDAAQKVVDKARGVLRQAYAVAKGHKCPIDDIKAYMKIKGLATGEVVTSHRNLNRILNLRKHPLGTQFDLFKVAADETDEATGRPKHPAMDAELQGQAAWRNKEPLTNCPFPAGSEERVAWEGGWHNAQAAAVRSMGPGANGAETSAT